jgi:hypothetical protein
MKTHEPLGRTHLIAGSSDRAFGVFFASLFVIAAILPLSVVASVRAGTLAFGLLLLICALAWPSLLRPFNHLWFRLGLLLHRAVSPLVLAALLYLVIAPMGLLLRVLGKDLLRLRWEPDADSYWIRREPGGHTGGTMADQF